MGEQYRVAHRQHRDTLLGQFGDGFRHRFPWTSILFGTLSSIFCSFTMFSRVGLVGTPYASKFYLQPLDEFMELLLVDDHKCFFTFSWDLGLRLVRQHGGLVDEISQEPDLLFR